MNICIINCFDTYEHRVDLLVETFQSAGHKVIVMASDFKHIEKTKRKDAKSNYLYFKTRPYQKNLSVDRIYSHMEFSKNVSTYVRRKIDKIDMFWVLVPPNSIVKEISKIKREYPNKKLVYDLIDLWPETMPMGKIKGLFPFSYWKNMRDKWIKNADCVVTECDLYRKKLKNVLHGMNVYTLYLARTYVEYKPNLHLPNDRISLCYLGSINNIIDIDTIAEIIRQCRIVKPVELHIIGDGESRDELINKAQNAGAEVIYHAKVYDRERKQYILDGCHYGLNVMKKTVCVGLTMKSMDYMEFGLPMINNIKGDTWDLIDQEELGINYGKEISILEPSIEMRHRVRSYFEHKLTIDEFVHRIQMIVNKENEKL